VRKALELIVKGNQKRTTRRRWELGVLLKERRSLRRNLVSHFIKGELME
jgi:hypothetical protein